MKIKFIGVGSAFTTTKYYQSNMLLTSEAGKKMLIDCGCDARFSLTVEDQKSQSREINAVYISHLHSDHIGGMEWLALTTYFTPNTKKPKLFMEQNLMNELWDHSLKGGLECVKDKNIQLTDFFLCQPIQDNGSFIWEKVRFTLVKMPHVTTDYKNHYSYGLLIQPSETFGIFISTDTQFQPDKLKKISEKADIIFHDCETTPSRTGVHAHYDELCTLPVVLKQKIWLYHYQPDPDQKPEKDGFKGFVKKGQEFIF